MFKIVETIENGTKNYNAVPANWEKSGTLFWPKHTKWFLIEKLRKNGLSMPNESWTRMHCKVTAFANTYIDGLQLERLYESFNNTEVAERYAQKPKVPKSSVKRVSTETVTRDSNEMIEVLNYNEGMRRIEGHEEVMIKEESFDSFTMSRGESSPNPYTETDQSNMEMAQEFASLPVTNATDLTSFCTKIYREISEIKRELENINERQEESCVQINGKLDNILKHHGEVINIDMTEIEYNLTKDDKFPLRDLQQIITFNQKLHNEAYQTEMVRRLSTIGGTTKTNNGAKVLYKLMDYCFDPLLLNEFSWTGSSRTGQKKHCFQKLQNVVEIIFQVISLADSRHSRTKNEMFLKEKILKHTGQRLKRKRFNSVYNTWINKSRD